MQDKPGDLPAFGAASGKRRAADTMHPPGPKNKLPHDTVKLKRKAGQTARDMELPPDNISPTDHALANGLVDLVSKLEYGRAKLEALPAGNNLAAALPIIVIMLRQVVQFARQPKGLPQDDPALTGALARAEELCGHAATLENQVASSPWQKLLGVFGAGPAAPGKRAKKIGSQVLANLPLVLEDFFVLFKVGFAANASAEEWRQTYEPFLVDLKNVVTSLH